MRFLGVLATAAVASFGGISAKAATFSFSYSFGAFSAIGEPVPVQIQGIVEGNQTDIDTVMVENIVSVEFHGHAMSGVGNFTGSYSQTVIDGQVAGAGTLSFSGANNDFGSCADIGCAGAGLAISTDSIYVYFPHSLPRDGLLFPGIGLVPDLYHDFGDEEYRYSSALGNDEYLFAGSFNSANWSLTEITTVPNPVPLPAGGVLLMSGLGALAIGRRKAKTRRAN